MKHLSAALPFILLGCVEMISSIRPVQQYEVEQAVQEDVLRELMRKMRPPGEVICIRVHYGDGPLYKQDPSTTFLARFRNVAPEVYPGSECGLPEDGFGNVQHRQSGRTAILYDVAILHWLPSGEAKVIGGWTAGGLTASECTYKVRREGAKWRAGECQDWVIP